MANDFIIKKGRSNYLFYTNGECKIPQEKLIENCWYLTTDTAEVYVALRQQDGFLALKRLNDFDIDTDFDFDSFDERLTTLEEEEKIHTYGYRSAFPPDGQGIEGHMYVAVDEQTTYVYFGGNFIPVGEVNETPEIIYGGNAD